LADHRSHRYAALKVLVASVAETSNELKVHRRLAQARPIYSGRVVQLLDEFKYTSGPNDIYICLIFELMGPNVSSMLGQLPCFRFHMEFQYPIWMAKRILRQVLEALEFLHQNGIAHGDLRPGNMLFALKNLDHIEDSKMHQDRNYEFGSISPPVQRLDGTVDRWAPKYLAVCQPLDEFTDISSEFRIKLSDLGSC
jgi:serine/threonine protein kinase